MAREDGYSDISDGRPQRKSRTRFGFGRSKLNRVLARNARWAAEARYCPPLYAEDDI